MDITAQTIEQLKAAGHYFAAGALAASLNQSRNYGCHYGMKSHVEIARREFHRGFDAATRSVDQ